jgi:perosamine synthetase
LKKFIPVNEPLITRSDIRSVQKILNSGWISSEGPEVKLFEKSFSRYIGHNHAIAVSSGTAALEVAVKSLNLRKGDEVIAPNFTIISSILAAIKSDLKIKFIDCGLYDWNMNLDKTIKAITKKTKVIIATHIYNFPFRIDLIKKICDQNKIILIEDAAEVLGQKIYNKKCGSFGHISTFSFYANKQITTGEGGMITTNNNKLAAKMSSLRNLAFGKKDRFNHDDIGWNYRMTNIQAALGLNQLKRLDKIVKKRHAIGRRFFTNLKNNNNIFIPKPRTDYSENIYWVIGVLIVNKSLKIDARIIMQKLNKYGIGTRPFFWPMHKQKVFRNSKLFKSKNFRNSEYLSKYGFYLPSSLSLTNNKIDYICNIVNKIIK